MKNAKASSLFHQQSCTAVSTKNTSGLLVLAALLLSGLAVPTAAQSAAITRIAPKQGFTIPAGVSTPIVLKTSPDAACDLRAEGANDKGIRFYANGDGYLKMHVTPKLDETEGELQLDCKAADGKVTRYPLHVRASSSPTVDMPAPQTVMPVPQGSRMRPALMETEMEQLSDQELARRGYPQRPDAIGAPDDYAAWREIVSRPMTQLPSHRVSRDDIRHHTQQVQEGDEENYNWSGYVATGNAGNYMNIHAYWNVPGITECESGNSTYSALWVGLDGFNENQLTQAGTEQDCYYAFFAYITSYSAWEEFLPLQPTSQQLDLSPNPGDNMFVQVFNGNAAGQPKVKGGYFWYEVDDKTQGQYVYSNIPYSACDPEPYFCYPIGATAEWVAERPGLGGNTLAELSDYDWDKMTNAYVWTGASKYLEYSQTNAQELWMYNEYINGDDNNKLSSAANDGASTIYFQWHNFH